MTFYAYFPSPEPSVRTVQVALPQFTPVSVDIT